MSTTTSDLLTKAAVRIDIAGQPNGSGFFISPAWVVTCAHVLEPYLATSSIARPTLGIVDVLGGQHELAGTPLVNVETDLALLQLARADTSVAAVLLDDGFEINDTLQSFGFPQNKPYGEPVTFNVEGQTGDPVPRIKFKQGQVRPGASGSALLNLRTGAVCGILRRTRNEKTDLGGYGIRVTTLLSVFETVSRLNAEANAADRRWLDSLDSHQLQRVRSASTPTAAYTEFVLRVSQQDDEWRVAALEAPGGDVGAVAVDLNAVRTEVPRLFRAWKAQGRIDDGEQSRLLGRVLYRSIMPLPIGTELERLAFSERRPVHVSLYFDPEMDTDLVHLPWEHLYVENDSTKTSLGVAAQMTLTRVCHPKPLADPPTAPPTASVLVLSAPVRGHREVSTTVDALLDRIDKLDAVKSSARTDTELTLDELGSRISSGDEVSVLHYVGYGRYQSTRDEIALRDSDTSDPEFVDVDQLGQALFPRPPRLVVIQTHGADENLVPVDPTAFAMPLLNQGVEAVVAFPYPLTGSAAVKAATGLYERLATGAPIRAAVQEIRRSERASPWSRPALFMRRPSDIALCRAGERRFP